METKRRRKDERKSQTLPQLIANVSNSLWVGIIITMTWNGIFFSIKKKIYSLINCNPQKAERVYSNSEIKVIIYCFPCNKHWSFWKISSVYRNYRDSSRTWFLLSVILLSSRITGGWRLILHDTCSVNCQQRIVILLKTLAAQMSGT